MKAVDALSTGRRETDVQARSFVRNDGARRAEDPECHAAFSVAQRAVGLAQALVADLSKCGVVEALRLRDVAHSDGNMIDHRVLLCCEILRAKNSPSTTHVSLAAA